jgi:hypothetical protein
MVTRTHTSGGHFENIINRKTKLEVFVINHVVTISSNQWEIDVLLLTKKKVIIIINTIKTIGFRPEGRNPNNKCRLVRIIHDTALRYADTQACGDRLTPGEP